MVDPFSEEKTGEESDWRWGGVGAGDEFCQLVSSLRGVLETLNSDSNRICEQNGQSRDLY